MRIAQIVNFYLGARRVENPLYKSDRLFFLKKHLEATKSVPNSVKDFIFVFNTHGRDALLDEAIELIRSHTENTNCNITTMVRENLDYSYGAWDFALKEFVGEYDYSILMEDDYIPVSENYDKKFLELFDEDDIFYICQFYTNQIIGKWHCAIANGMIKNKIFEDHFKEYKEGFNLCGAGGDYGKAEWNQSRFLDRYVEKGYKIKDITEKYYVPFLNYRSSIVGYGSSENEILLAPIWPPYSE